MEKEQDFLLKLPVQSVGLTRTFQKEIQFQKFVFVAAKKGEDLPNKNCRAINGTETFGSCDVVCKGKDVTQIFDGTAYGTCKKDKKTTGPITLYNIHPFASFWAKS